MEVHFIDTFVMPAQAKEEFLQRANINRSFIKTLPGFVTDSLYEQQNGDEYRAVTVATWRDMDAYTNAKKTVGEEYQREGFDMPAMMKRLNIQIQRGVYTKAAV